MDFLLIIWTNPRNTAWFLTTTKHVVSLNFHGNRFGEWSAPLLVTKTQKFCWWLLFVQISSAFFYIKEKFYVKKYSFYNYFIVDFGKNFQKDKIATDIGIFNRWNYSRTIRDESYRQENFGYFIWTENYCAGNNLDSCRIVAGHRRFEKNRTPSGVNVFRAGSFWNVCCGNLRTDIFEGGCVGCVYNRIDNRCGVSSSCRSTNDTTNWRRLRRWTQNPTTYLGWK